MPMFLALRRPVGGRPDWARRESARALLVHSRQASRAPLSSDAGAPADARELCREAARRADPPVRRSLRRSRRRLHKGGAGSPKVSQWFAHECIPQTFLRPTYPRDSSLVSAAFASFLPLRTPLQAFGRERPGRRLPSARRHVRGAAPILERSHFIPSALSRGETGGSSASEYSPTLSSS
jgi:hypothetical protein